MGQYPLLVEQNHLFVGDICYDTATNTANGRLRSIAVYDIEQNKWSAITPADFLVVH
jgi:hypothetical protein